MANQGQTDFLQALFFNLPTGVLVADDQRRYVTANPAACRLLGRTREELLASRVGDFVPEARRKEVDAQWRGFLRDGSQSGVFEFELPDGETRSVHFKAIANFVPGMHFSLITAAPIADQETDMSTERFLKVCAWTKKVFHNDRWLVLEEYLSEAHGLRVSHGLSPDAFPEASGTD